MLSYNTKRPAVPMSDRRAQAIEAMYSTAHWLVSRRRWSDASDVFRAMAFFAPSDERGWLGLGTCHESLGHGFLALQMYGVGFAMSRSVRCELRARTPCGKRGATRRRTPPSSARNKPRRSTTTTRSGCSSLPHGVDMTIGPIGGLATFVGPLPTPPGAASTAEGPTLPPPSVVGPQGATDAMSMIYLALSSSNSSQFRNGETEISNTKRSDTSRSSRKRRRSPPSSRRKGKEAGGSSEASRTSRKTS